MMNLDKLWITRCAESKSQADQLKIDSEFANVSPYNEHKNQNQVGEERFDS